MCSWGYFFIIITGKTRTTERKWDGVGVMKDKELKLEDVKTPHTLGWVSYNYSYTSIHTTIVIHRRSRQLLWGTVGGTKEPEWEWEWRGWYGEGVCVYPTFLQSDTGKLKIHWGHQETCCLLWIKKERVKDKTYTWVSVRWKTKNTWLFIKTKSEKSTCLVYTGSVCLLWINKSRVKEKTYIWVSVLCCLL